MDRGELERSLERDYEEGLQEIIEANPDLRERACGNLHAVYDEEDDLFILTIGEDDGAVSFSVDDDLVIRHDFDTPKVIAFELYHFRELLAKHSPYIRFCFDMMQACGLVDIQMLPTGGRRHDRTGDISKEFVQIVSAGNA